MTSWVLKYKLFFRQSSNFFCLHTSHPPSHIFLSHFFFLIAFAFEIWFVIGVKRIRLPFASCRQCCSSFSIRSQDPMRKISTTNIYLTTNFDQIIWYWSHQEKKRHRQKRKKESESSNLLAGKKCEWKQLFKFKCILHFCTEECWCWTTACACACVGEWVWVWVYVDVPVDRSEMNETKHTKRKICHH